ncbi:hypothetical protein [uncultured Sphingomonas sp.]|uniref:hypothetical protein n=1 Tax=uncultured Sphingomonas sp. TaxID=158754 RepID=UPI002626B1DA|nr:hypothetical protein [uncultured Sphingomonas sp.]
MLATLMALSFVPNAPAPTPTGAIIATAGQTVKFDAAQTSVATVAGLPLGSPLTAQPLDPADLNPRAFDFSALIGDAKIAQIVRITMSAAAATVGVEVWQDSPRVPIIDAATSQIVQIWFAVDPAFQSDPGFSGAGLQVGVSILIQTDAAVYQTYERTGILTVRNL